TWRCAVSRPILSRACSVFSRDRFSLRSQARKNRRRCSSISARPLPRPQRPPRRNVNLIFGGSASPKTMPNQRRGSRLIMASRSENAIHLGLAGLVFLFAIQLRAAEVIPPKPDRYFNDYAGVVSKETAYRFNEQLAQFERETSDQVVVAVFPKMQS